MRMYLLVLLLLVQVGMGANGAHESGFCEGGMEAGIEGRPRDE